MANPYQLDQKAHDQEYADISRVYLEGVSSHDKPRAIITGGQPGSGKGGLTEQAKQEMSAQGGYVLVDPDHLRQLHPHQHELMQKNDREAANLTHPDASKWAKHLTDDAIKGRHNLIIDQTSKSPESLVALTTKLKEAGYEVELRAIAVKAEISEQRIHTRYEDEKQRDGYGRFVPKDVHDAAYKGLPESVAAIELSKTVDRIAIHDKNQKCVYENTVVDGEWAQPSGAKVAMETERARALTPQDYVVKVEAYTKLVDQMDKRGADPAERDAMEAQRVHAIEQLANAKEQSLAPAETSRGQVARFQIDDLSGAAFQDLGRNVELGQVLRDAAERIGNGEKAPFDLNDTNGNPVGRYDIVPAAEAAATPVGGASLTVDLNQPAFVQDREGQLAQYLNHASENIGNSHAGANTVIPAANGQAMGALQVSPEAPAPQSQPQPASSRSAEYSSPSM